MPATRITTNFILGDRRENLCQAFHATMQQVLKIKEYDRLIVVDEKPETLFQPLNTQGKYALVEITLFTGRTLETKRELYKRIVDLFSGHGVAKKSIRIILYEVDRENWGIRGGKAATDVDLGFSTNV